MLKQLRNSALTLLCVIIVCGPSVVIFLLWLSPTKLSVPTSSAPETDWIGINDAVSQYTAVHAPIIIIAIEKYRRENGFYPKNLASLVPIYIPKIELIIGRFEWRYSVDRWEDTFILEYGLYPELRHGYPSMYYERRTNKWMCDC